MDTSEQYIEMCSKATEIQELYNNFSTVSLDNRNFIKIIEWNEVTNKMGRDFAGHVSMQYNKREKVIWLPRQDQLQEMLEGNFFENLEKFNSFMYSSGTIKVKTDLTESELDRFRTEFIIFANDPLSRPLVIETKDLDFINIQNPLTSLEQLWLAFVMKEKYNKVWNQENKEWQLIKS